MIRRHFTADCLNVVVNDPSVYPWIRGGATGRIDLDPVVKNEDNVLLMGEHGGVLFLKHSRGVYEAHTQVLPAGRGKWTLDMVNEALEHMFTQTDCMDIMTRCPLNNIPARSLARAIHGRKEFRLENGWVTDEGMIPADIYSLQIQTWLGNAPDLEKHGERFHNRLTEEYARLGKNVGPNHQHDPVHDRYVGGAFLMIRNGQAPKGVVMYNRWATIAGYIPINIASMDPLVIDIQESLLAVENGDFFVLRIK